MSKTIEQIIDLVDEIRPNAFSNAVKTAWISQVEGRIQTEVFLQGEKEVVSYSWDEDRNREVLVNPPYDNLYELHLAAMIDFNNGEYDKYQNDTLMFNEALGAFVRYFAGRYDPAQGDRCQCNLPTYYITAYGIAVKNGFSGSEQEWLESLMGSLDLKESRGRLVLQASRVTLAPRVSKARQAPGVPKGNKGCRERRGLD